MRECEICGRETDSDFIFCPFCGEPLGVTAQDPRRALKLVLAAKHSWQQRAMIDVSVPL